LIRLHGDPFFCEIIQLHVTEIFHFVTILIFCCGFNNIPTLTGIEFTEVVRQHHPDIPIALITGVAHTLGENDLEQVGISKLFTKPFDLDEIATWIQSLPS